MFGCLEVGQDLPLVQEAPDDGVGVHAAPDQLDRDPPVILAVGALRQVDGAHAAAPELAEHPVRPDALADEGVGGSSVAASTARAQSTVRAEVSNRSSAATAASRSDCTSAPQRSVRAVCRDETLALAFRHAEGVGGDGLDVLPFFAGHRS